jgi:hypothetical protein
LAKFGNFTYACFAPYALNSKLTNFQGPIEILFNITIEVDILKFPTHFIPPQNQEK